LKNNFQIILFS